MSPPAEFPPGPVPASATSYGRPAPPGSASYQPVFLETARLALRPPEAADIATMARLADNLAVASMTARLPFPYRESDARSFVQAQEAERLAGRDLAFVIEARDGTGLLGCIGLHRRDTGRVEIGYWLGEPHWGSGYATEAARAVIDYGFERLDLEVIGGECRVINDRSRRVLEKCGLHYTGSGLSAAPARGGALPVDRFELTHRNWQSLKAWRPALVRDMAESGRA